MTEATAPCLLCGWDTAGSPDYGRIVCTACEHGLDHDLSGILTAATTAAATPPVLAPRQSGPRGKPGSRPPMSLDNVDPALADIDEIEGDPSTRTTVLALLESYARMWRKVTRLSAWGSVTEPSGPGLPSPEATLATVIRDLRRWTPHMLADPRWPTEEYAEHVRRSLHTLRHLDHYARADRDRGLRIACPADRGDTACGHKLRVDPTSLASDIHCPRCGSVWTAKRLLLVALHDERVQVWGYVDDVAEAVRVPTRTLRDWAAKGRIGRSGSRVDAGAAFRLRHAAALTG